MQGLGAGWQEHRGGAQASGLACVRAGGCRRQRGPRLPAQTSRLPGSMAGRRPGQGQSPGEPVLLFLSSGPPIGVTTERLTQPET